MGATILSFPRTRAPSAPPPLRPGARVLIVAPGDYDGDEGTVLRDPQPGDPGFLVAVAGRRVFFPAHFLVPLANAVRRKE